MPADCVEPGSRAAIEELFVTARASGRASEVRVRLAERHFATAVSATPFRADDRQCLLVRARRVETVTDFFEQMPEAAVITDSSGRIRMANPAFVALARAGDESRLRGWLVGDALGDVQGQWAVLLAQVRANGLVGGVGVTLNVAGAAPMRADVSGALLAEGEQEDLGFTLRVQPPSASSEPLAAGLAELVARVGHAPLPDLLVQAVAWAEHHLVESALERGQGRLETAAALLGIPADSLLLRVQRLGLSHRLLLN
jgi:transcriptional regulator of acetoin/glycerol metabolism